MRRSQPLTAPLARLKVGKATTRWGSKTVTTSTFKTISDRSERLAVGLKEIGVGEGTLCSYMVPPGEDAMVMWVHEIDGADYADLLARLGARVAETTVYDVGR